MSSVPASDLFDQPTTLPIELDPGYVAPEEPIEEMVIPRRPRVGEWVQGFRPVTNGTGLRRGLVMILGRVQQVMAGDYEQGGCIVREWDRRRVRFGSEIFMPWSCVMSRVTVNHYSLTVAS